MSENNDKEKKVSQEELDKLFYSNTPKKKATPEEAKKKFDLDFFTIVIFVVMLFNLLAALSDLLSVL